MTEPSIDQRQNSMENLEMLAKELAINYLNASTLDLEHTNRAESTYRRELVDEILFGVRKINHSSRNILVIGAGCTYNIHKDIPLARDAIKTIHSKIRLDKRDFSQIIAQEAPTKSRTRSRIFFDQAIRNKYWDEYKRLKLHSSDYGSDVDADFETSLNLLSKILPLSTIRDLIKKIYNHRHGPILFYEIVAHLFKHRFIDAIINFNFDEFLDLSIQEELGRDGYDAVLSDGDCRPLRDLSQEGRLRQPLYIKPHGTASHKSTLRFTKDHYYELPLDMREFLSDLISCRNIRPRRSVNLITVGFEMNSLEFNDILRNDLPLKSRIFSFYFHKDEAFIPEEREYLTANYVVQKREEHLSKIFQGLPKRRQPEFLFIGHEFFDGQQVRDETVNDFQHTLGNSFNLLHKKIKGHYQSPFQPRRMSRHLLISNIFGSKPFLAPYVRDPKKRHRYFTSADYYSDRLLIEILIAIAVNKGNIDLPLLMMGRIGHYYSLYHNTCKSTIQPVSKFAQFFYENEETEIERFNECPPYPNNGQIFETAEQKFCQTKNKLVSPKLQNFFNGLSTHPELRNVLKKNFQNLRNSNRSNIKSELRGTTHHIFDDYNPSNLLNTDLSVDLHYNESLREGTRVNALWIVAEHGIQLSKFLRKISERKISVRLILADRDKKKDPPPSKQSILEQLREKHNRAIKNGSSLGGKEMDKLAELIDIRLLPSNRHNHHMALFMTVKDGEKKLAKDLQKGENRGIYYYQAGLDLNINPIRIVESVNLEALKNKFEYYWKMAKKHPA